MTGCNVYCSTPLGEQVLNDCAEKIEGGIAEAILFVCGHEPADPSDANEIESILADGNARHVKEVKMGINKPSPVKPETKVSGRSPKVSIYEITGTLIDANVSTDSQAFYDGLDSVNGRVIGAILAAPAGDDPVAYFIKPPKGVVFEGGAVVPNDTDDFTHYDYEFHYKAKKAFDIVDAPVGIFGN